MILTEIGHEEVPDTDSLFQSRFWARFKETRGMETRCFMIDSPLYRGALVSLIRVSASGERYLYVPRGPEAYIDESSRGILLEDLSAAIAEKVPDDIACVRFDTIFPSPYTEGEYWTANGQWKGAPRSELRELRMNFGTRTRALRKAPVDHLCPDTVIIGLQGTDDELLARMRSTTRNCVRRAFRSGVAYRRESADWLHEWHRIYEETARRKGFYFETLPYFESLLEGASASPVTFMILSATKDGQTLAGIILGISGRSGYYLYAGSSTEGRECMPNYGLQWEAMRLLRDHGCTEYDLMGVPPNGDPNHSMFGLYTFKTGLGGRIEHFTGCWDFPLDEKRYARMVNAENMGMI
jgi:lipid II:glycine glycyltransferase (peptidoglycan interpeptide bridge formation enzyme)